MIQSYVLGFLFRDAGRQVALIEKNKPDWMRGLLNGVGGKIESGESPHAAMGREFAEETGAGLFAWTKYLTYTFPKATIHVFHSHHGGADICSTTDEPVAWYQVSDLPNLKVVANLPWLIAMALCPEGPNGILTGSAPETARGNALKRK